MEEMRRIILALVGREIGSDIVEFGVEEGVTHILCLFGLADLWLLCCLLGQAAPIE